MKAERSMEMENENDDDFFKDQPFFEMRREKDAVQREMISDKAIKETSGGEQGQLQNNAKIYLKNRPVMKMKLMDAD